MPTSDPLQPRRHPRGAGGPFILILLGATVAGFLLHQPTIGFLTGLATALAVTLLLWLGDRRR